MLTFRRVGESWNGPFFYRCSGFRSKDQQAIGREQSFEVTEACNAKCRTRGVTSLNADILYGFPNRIEESLERSIEQLMGLKPD